VTRGIVANVLTLVRSDHLTIAFVAGMVNAGAAAAKDDIVLAGHTNVVHGPRRFIRNDGSGGFSSNGDHGGMLLCFLFVVVVDVLVDVGVHLFMRDWRSGVGVGDHHHEGGKLRSFVVIVVVVIDTIVLYCWPNVLSLIYEKEMPKNEREVEELIIGTIV